MVVSLCCYHLYRNSRYYTDIRSIILLIINFFKLLPPAGSRGNIKGASKGKRHERVARARFTSSLHLLPFKAPSSLPPWRGAKVGAERGAKPVPRPSLQDICVMGIWPQSLSASLSASLASLFASLPASLPASPSKFSRRLAMSS